MVFMGSFGLARKKDLSSKEEAGTVGKGKSQIILVGVEVGVGVFEGLIRSA